MLKIIIATLVLLIGASAHAVAAAPNPYFFEEPFGNTTWRAFGFFNSENQATCVIENASKTVDNLLLKIVLNIDTGEFFIIAKNLAWDLKLRKYPTDIKVIIALFDKDDEPITKATFNALALKKDFIGLPNVKPESIIKILDSFRAVIAIDKTQYLKFEMVPGLMGTFIKCMTKATEMKKPQ